MKRWRCASCRLLNRDLMDGLLKGYCPSLKTYTVWKELELNPSHKDQHTISVPRGFIVGRARGWETLNLIDSATGNLIDSTIILFLNSQLKKKTTLEQFVLLIGITWVEVKDSRYLPYAYLWLIWFRKDKLNSMAYLLYTTSFYL